MGLADRTVTEFVQELGSPSPAPGGGSAAALAGALGAALVAMVCQLTIGRKSYQEVSAEFEGLLPHAEAKSRELLALMDADAEAYRRVIAAYKLPRETDAEKQTREAEVQEALKAAANVPLEIARACAEVLEQTMGVSARGNKNAASDAGAGALLAEAGLQAAILNVEINLGLIRDTSFVGAVRAELEPLRAVAARRDAILDAVRTRL